MCFLSAHIIKSTLSWTLVVLLISTTFETLDHILLISIESPYITIRYGIKLNVSYWKDVARAVGGKTPDEVKSHYELLLRDISQIESGKVPYPNYKKSAEHDEEEKRYCMFQLHHYKSTNN